MALPAAAVVAPTSVTVTTTAAPVAPVVAPTPAITGYVNIDLLGYHFTIAPMAMALVFGALVAGVMFYRAQRDEDAFDFMDLFMEAGKASKTAVIFFATWSLTTWVIVDQELKNTLSESIFWAYCLAWVSPLVAKEVFGKKDFQFPTSLGGKKEGE